MFMMIESSKQFQTLPDDFTGHIEASSLLKAMSNEARLMILCRLCEHEMKVSELEGIIGLSQSAISQHLAVLRDNKLVSSRREGQSMYYSLNGKEPRAIIEVLYKIYAGDSCGATVTSPDD